VELLLQERVGQLAELETQEAASWFEDSVSLLHDAVDVGGVANSKCNGVGVHGSGLDGELLGIALHPGDLV